MNNNISPFKLRSYFHDNYIKEKINQVGELFSKYEKYKFVDIVKRERKNIFVEIENIYGKEKKITTYKILINESGNPFRSTKFTPKILLEERINKIGRNQKEWFKFKFLKKDEKVGYVIVENIKTKEQKRVLSKSIIRGKSNPFHLSKGYSVQYATFLINQFKKKYKNPFEQFEIFKFEGRGKNRKLSLINKKTNRIKTVNFQSFINKKYNPFLLKKELPPEYFIPIVNKIGSSFKKDIEKSKFISYFRKGKNNELFIVLENLVTKQQITTKFQSFVKRINPFNDSQERTEVLKVQPALLKLLKKYNFKEIKKEFKISSRSKVDFLCVYEKDGKEVFLVIEVKCDNKKNNKFELESQIKKYKEDIKQFGEKTNVILTSPKGTYGISFNKLESFLQKNIK